MRSALVKAIVGFSTAVYCGRASEVVGRLRGAPNVLVVVQRADRGRIAEGQIVPGPPGAVRLVDEPVVVADDPPLDAPHAVLPEGIGNGGHRGRQLRPIAGRRIAGAADHQVAPDGAVTVHGRRRADRGLEREVPSKPLGRGGHSQKLRVRRRDEELVGIEREDDVSRPVERLDHAPHMHAVDRRCGKKRRDVLATPTPARSEAAESARDDGRRACVAHARGGKYQRENERPKSKTRAAPT